MGAGLEAIIREGTSLVRKGTGKPSNMIRCVDGFKVSVIANEVAYCAPRPGWGDGVPDDYEGPFHEVELGFPSERPEPWADWEQYAESHENPTGTVYGYVPVGMVRALIALHGDETAVS